MRIGEGEADVRHAGFTVVRVLGVSKSIHQPDVGLLWAVPSYPPPLIARAGRGAEPAPRVRWGNYDVDPVYQGANVMVHGRPLITTPAIIIDGDPQVPLIVRRDSRGFTTAALLIERINVVEDFVYTRPVNTRQHVAATRAVPVSEGWGDELAQVTDPRVVNDVTDLDGVPRRVRRPSVARVFKGIGPAIRPIGAVTERIRIVASDGKDAGHRGIRHSVGDARTAGSEPLHPKGGKVPAT